MVAIFLIGIGVVLFVIALFLEAVAFRRSQKVLVTGAEHRAPDLAETLFRVFLAILHLTCDSAISVVLAILGLAMIIGGLVLHFFG